MFQPVAETSSGEEEPGWKSGYSSKSGSKPSQPKPAAPVPPGSLLGIQQRMSLAKTNAKAMRNKLAAKSSAESGEDEDERLVLSQVVLS